MSDPKTIKIEKNEKRIRLNNRLKLPKLKSFSFFTYLEKSPKFTKTMEKYANNVPVTLIKGYMFFFEKKFS